MKYLKLKTIIKSIFIINLFFSFTNVNAQSKWNTKEKIYSNGVYVRCLYKVEESKIVSLKPIGKNVKVTYDPYYDSYLIDWNEINDKWQMKLIPEKATDNGTIYIDSNTNKLRFFVINTLEKDRKIQLVSTEIMNIDGKEYKLIMAFEDFY